MLPTTRYRVVCGSIPTCVRFTKYDTEGGRGALSLMALVLIYNFGNCNYSPKRFLTLVRLVLSAQDICGS